ncbi:MAG: hypothetical protein C5B54_08350 [Acidobacteria bacterium]|nr:MAG: hypothetical protein C5B54_08350 [Acidobacteriota bacterium]
MDLRSSRKAEILALIPVLLLLLVAGLQIYLARTANLSPWKGGGFGMFSTTDGIANRWVRVYVRAPERSEELVLKGDLADLAGRAQLFPGNPQLERLAREIVRDQQQKKLPVDTVQIEVRRALYNRIDLHPTQQLIRDYTYTTRN